MKIGCLFASVVILLVAVRTDAKPVKLLLKELQDLLAERSTCSAAFLRWSPTSSACLRGPVTPLPTAHKKEILYWSNHFRATVTPPATNMQKMYWDAGLEMLAQKLADQCVFAHDTNQARYWPGKYPVGQNIASTHRVDKASWPKVVKKWQGEVKHFVFGKPTSKVVGHYTQLVWHDSARVGCGYAQCHWGNFFVCNYAKAGNKPPLYLPYTTGSKSQCGSTNGLCDCGGKVCCNGGTLDLKTCTCSCRRTGRRLPLHVVPFFVPGYRNRQPPFLVGRNCYIACKLATDLPQCGAPGGFTQSDCYGPYANVRYQYCPIMCGICAG